MDKEIDILSIFSVVLGIENLLENRQQSADNDVNKANDKQAQYMLTELKRLFDEQNRKIDRILEILEENNENH